MLVTVGNSFQKLPRDGKCGQYGWNCGSTVSNMEGLGGEKLNKGLDRDDWVGKIVGQVSCDRKY